MLLSLLTHPFLFRTTLLPSDSYEQWEPEVAAYWNGELILQPKHYRTRKEQVWLLEHHPMFTGSCPSCGAIIDSNYQARVHWDCNCGWIDDSI